MKNKIIRISIDILLILIGVVFLIFGIKDAVNYYKEMKITDGQRFHSAYSYVSEEESVYEYISVKEAIKKLDSNDAIILIGEPTNAWTQVLVKPLNDIIKEKKGTIYYLDTTDINESNKDYQELLNNLDLEKAIFPVVIIVKDKTVISVLDKTLLYDKYYDGAPIDYFTDEKLNTLKSFILANED